MAKFLDRNRQIIIFTIILIVFFCIIYAMRSVLLPFIVGLVLAYLVLPVVLWIERHLPGKGRWMRFKRIATILFIYLIVLGLIALLAYLTIPALISSITALIDSLPVLVPSIIQRVQDISANLQQHIPIGIRDAVNSYITNLMGNLGNIIQSGLTTGISYIPATIGLVLGFASLPLFLFFLVLDAEKLTAAFYSPFPSWIAEHTRKIVSILQEVLGRYIRAQLLMGVIIGVVDLIWLMILGIPFAPALAFLSALMELVPVLGPWIGGAVGVIVTLATKPEKILWVIIFYVVVQLLEGNVLSPRVQGSIMHIHPAIILILIILGGHFAGFWGIVLIIPVVATLVPIYKYLHQTIKDNGINPTT
jgi:predicted PurR-regulated permease PerM